MKNKVCTIDNGSLNRFTGDACSKLVAGPTSQSVGLFAGGLYSIVGGLTSDFLCRGPIANIVTKIVQSKTNVKDLKVGSSAIQRINNYNSTIPMIAISSAENSPVHWRLISSTMTNNKSDNTFVRTMKTARGVYNGFIIVNFGLAVVTGILGIFNPFLWTKTVSFGYTSTQWKKGRDWIDNSETAWCSLIGATKQVSHTVTTTSWVINRKWMPWKWAFHGSRGPAYEKTTTKTYYTTVRMPSDGGLNLKTQTLNTIPPGNRYYIPGANHVEVHDMRHAVEGDLTKLRFKQIFDRSPINFFHTP